MSRPEEHLNRSIITVPWESILLLARLWHLTLLFVCFDVINIFCRTPDGEMFVVKDPDLFASNIIPQYFDHNKFSSFARQLNFYGFRKMQSKPIRNSDFDSNTAKHVTFFNENFKRGRCDLLKKIQRSTRGGGTSTAQDHQREVQNLKEQVTTLENKVSEMSQQFEERMRRLELDMLGRVGFLCVLVLQVWMAFYSEISHGTTYLSLFFLFRWSK